MKAKALKQITSQSFRINLAIALSHMPNEEKLTKMSRIKSISRRYGANMVRHLHDIMGPADLNEFGAITPVSAEIYAR